MELLLNQEHAMRILIGFISGFIIGLERQKEIERGTGKQAGLRTFSLIGLLGAIAFLPGESTLAISASIAFGMVLAIYAYYRMFGIVEIGITTSVAMIVTFTLGALSGLGYLTEAIAGSLITTLVLTTKYELRHLAMRISKEELLSAVELATLVTLIYPLIPNVTDPITNSLNLKTAYFIARLLMTISFINYVMLKILGPKGVIPFGLLGGFVSSEATTYTAYMELKGGRIALATALASLIALYIKVVIIVAILERSLVYYIINKVLIVLTLLIIIAALLSGKASVSLEKLPSPISYTSALKFTATFLAISFFAAIIEKYAAQYYLIAVILSSLVSVTAVTFSIVALVCAGMISLEKASTYLLIAMAVGALNKIIYASLACTDKREIAKLAAILLVIAIVLVLPYNIRRP